MRLPGGGSPSMLEIELRGERRLGVRIVDDATGRPIENAWALLQPSAGSAVRIGGERGENGKTTFAEIPPGRYLITVDGSEYAQRVEEIDLSEIDLDMEISLQVASWITLEFEGPTVRKEDHRVVATVLSGGDPDWRWVSSDGHLMAFVQ